MIVLVALEFENMITPCQTLVYINPFCIKRSNIYLFVFGFVFTIFTKFFPLFYRVANRLPYNLCVSFGVFFRFYPENYKDIHVHGKRFHSTLTNFTSSAVDWQTNGLMTRLVINGKDYCL